MKKKSWFVRIVLGFMILTLAFFPVAFLLPQRVLVARTVTIDAPPEHVFAYLNNPQQFASYEPWNKAKDPSLTHEFSGEESGVGAERSWKSDKYGPGHQKITASEPGKRVAQDLWFGSDTKPSKAEFTLTPKGDGTEVKWSLESDLGYNPIKRYFGLVMDSMLGPDLEEGLANLKTLAEKEFKEKPAEPAVENTPAPEPPPGEKAE